MAACKVCTQYGVVDDDKEDWALSIISCRHFVSLHIQSKDEGSMRLMMLVNMSKLLSGFISMTGHVYVYNTPNTERNMKVLKVPSLSPLRCDAASLRPGPRTARWKGP